MKLDKSRIIFGISLVILSAFFYWVHYLSFHDLHHLFIFLVGDVAFVFIEVLLVTMIIHQLLTYREKRALLEKMNMAIGAFFSEVGTHLLRVFSSADGNAAEIGRHLSSIKDWTDKDFASARRILTFHEEKSFYEKSDLQDIKDFLVIKRGFLLNLLQNPNLLEHDEFTNLLWAVFHLTEELEARKDLKSLTETDRGHLINDMKRAYTILLSEWLDYMKHLKGSYPYLFSLAVRTNPFDPNASAEVE